MTQKVCVTGAAGQAGRAVVAGLRAHGYHVTPVDVVVSGADRRDGMLRADLTDYGQAVEALSQADAVVHRRAIGDLDAADRHAFGDLVADRTQARQDRDWARADQIRAQLDELGVQVTDTPEGPIWQLRLGTMIVDLYLPHRGSGDPR